MIKVGINENVYLKSINIDAKNNLEIEFEEVGAKILSPFQNIASDDVVESAPNLSIKIFPPLPPKEDSDRTEEKKVDMLLKDINKGKGIMMHIMKQYMTTDAMPKLGGSVAYAGLLIDENNFSQQIQKKEILEGIFKNQANAFKQAMAPYVGKQDLPMRLLLVRQNTDKHYASFRGQFLDENPFLESMDIKRTNDPKTNQSKVKFTKYELDNGLDDGTPTSRKSADKPGGGGAAKPPDGPELTTDNVFN